ncbi:hypothetical protein [Chroococcidiopsis sp. CCMEE 29]|nr:hypothetical protein [Chroococcidiopsis sp. CCMEE 29]
MLPFSVKQPTTGYSENAYSTSCQSKIQNRLTSLAIASVLREKHFPICLN